LEDSVPPSVWPSFDETNVGNYMTTAKDNAVKLLEAADQNNQQAKQRMILQHEKRLMKGHK
jgi:hypothetical protein